MVGLSDKVGTSASSERRTPSFKVQGGFETRPTIASQPGGTQSFTAVAWRRRGAAEIVSTITTFAGRKIDGMCASPGAPVWQRGFFEYVMRSEAKGGLKPGPTIASFRCKTPLPPPQSPGKGGGGGRGPVYWPLLTAGFCRYFRRSLSGSRIIVV